MGKASSTFNEMKKINQFGKFQVLEHQLPYGEFRFWLARENSEKQPELLRYIRLDSDVPKTKDTYNYFLALFTECAIEMDRRFNENPEFCEKNLQDQQSRVEPVLSLYNEHSFACFKIGRHMTSNHEDRIGLWIFLDSKEWVNIWMGETHGRYDETDESETSLDWQDLDIERAKAFGESLLNLLKENPEQAKAYISKLLSASQHRIKESELDLWMIGFHPSVLDMANKSARCKGN